MTPDDESTPGSAEDIWLHQPLTYYRLQVFAPGEVQHPALTFTSRMPFAPLAVGQLLNLSGSVLAGDAPVESILRITAIEHHLSVVEEDALLLHAMNLYTEAVPNTPQARRREAIRNEVWQDPHAPQ